MINKTFKIIHNKFLRFFNFFFFLRYLLAIFLITITLFVSIPKFFNHEKKKDIIKDYLDNHYNLELKNFNTIKFNIFPLPNLSIKKSNLKTKDESIVFEVKNFQIFLKFDNIYSYENLKPKKIIFNEINTNLEVNQTKEILKYFDNLQHNFYIKSLNLNLIKDDKILLGLKDIYFSNYGFNKYKIDGQIFGKKFKAALNKDSKNLNFKILNTGIKAKFKFDKQNYPNFILGTSQISFPKNHLKFDFKLYEDRLEIIKSNLRNKDLSISFSTLVKLDPFFDVYTKMKIHQLNKEFLNHLDLKNIVGYKEIIKKLNSTNTLSYTAKKYSNNLIKDFYLEFNLAHGRLVFANNILISGGNTKCNGESLLVTEYPRLNFVCSFNLKDIKKIKKEFSIPKNIKLDPLDLNIEGSLNILNNKINFKKITNSKGYVANEEDIQYFKETFEKILFNKSFLKIFETLKVKEFILEVV